MIDLKSNHILVVLVKVRLGHRRLSFSLAFSQSSFVGSYLLTERLEFNRILFDACIKFVQIVVVTCTKSGSEGVRANNKDMKRAFRDELAQYALNIVYRGFSCELFCVRDRNVLS